MKIIAILSILVCLFLSACGISEKVMATHIAETLAAMPTATLIPSPTPEPTPTKIPLTDIPLKDIFLENEDYLPTGYSYGQFRSTPPEMFYQVSKYINIIHAQFSKKDETAGGVSVFVYDNQEDARRAFEIIFDGFGDVGKETSDEIGRLAYGVMDIKPLAEYLPGFQSTDMMVLKCNTVIMVRVSDTIDLTPPKSYLRQLLISLKPYICE